MKLLQNWERTQELQTTGCSLLKPEIKVCSSDCWRPHVPTSQKYVWLSWALEAHTAIPLITRQCLISWHSLLALWNCLETRIGKQALKSQLCSVRVFVARPPSQPSPSGWRPSSSRYWLRSDPPTWPPHGLVRLPPRELLQLNTILFVNQSSLSSTFGTYEWNCWFKLDTKLVRYIYPLVAMKYVPSEKEKVPISSVSAPN